jgi:hypothetical protein
MKKAMISEIDQYDRVAERHRRRRGAVIEGPQAGAEAQALRISVVLKRRPSWSHPHGQMIAGCAGL